MVTTHLCGLYSQLQKGGASFAATAAHVPKEEFLGECSAKP